AWTTEAGGFPLDLGCGWLHSADRNPWTKIAEAESLTVDRTAPPWGKQALEYGFSAAEQREFRAAIAAFYRRIESAGEVSPDPPLAHYLGPRGKWKALLNAISTYVNGVELDRASAQDSAAYEDTGVNWRVKEGYAAAIAAYAKPLRIAFGSAVRLIDH